MDPTKTLDLTSLIPNAIGHIAFDENNNVIDTSGVGKDRRADVENLSQVELEDGFALLEEKDVKIYIYKQLGKTIAVYAYEGPATADGNK
ncbi:hypothetical protein ACO0QE_000823 [Hanseniaspora vineae]